MRQWIVPIVALALWLQGCSTSTQGRKHSSKSAAPFNRSTPAFSSLEASFPGQQDTPIPIVGNEKDGWATAFGPFSLGRWSIANTQPTMMPLLWDVPVSVGSGFQGIVGGRFILGGLVSGQSGPQKIGEFDMNTGQLLATAEFGDKATRWGTSVNLGNGGLMACHYADPLVSPTPTNQVWLDVVYRAPYPPPPGSGIPQWEYRRYKFPTKEGTVALRMVMSAVQDSAGFVRVYVLRDSAGSVGEAVFRVEGFKLLLVRWNENFIPAYSAAAPSGEFPWITAAVDGDRILLAYQTYEDRFGPCPHPFQFWSPWHIIEITNNTFRVLGETEFWSSHSGQWKPMIFPRPDGVYFALEHFKADTDCSHLWEQGKFSDGKFTVTSQLPYGSVLSYSRDGWLLFLNRVTVQTDLIRMRFAPVITAKRSGNNVVLNWDQAAPTDRLERSTDLKTWAPSYYTGLPPVTIPASTREFFRVRQ